MTSIYHLDGPGLHDLRSGPAQLRLQFGRLITSLLALAEKPRTASGFRLDRAHPLPSLGPAETSLLVSFQVAHWLARLVLIRRSWPARRHRSTLAGRTHLSIASSTASQEFTAIVLGFVSLAGLMLAQFVWFEWQARAAQLCPDITCTDISRDRCASQPTRHPRIIWICSTSSPTGRSMSSASPA